MKVMNLAVSESCHYHVAAAHLHDLKYDLASDLTFWLNAADFMWDLGVKNGFMMTLKYTSYTSLKNSLIVSTFLPSCRSSNLI